MSRLEVVLSTWLKPNGAEFESQFLYLIAVLVFYCCIIEFHKFSKLKQYPFVVA